MRFDWHGSESEQTSFELCGADTISITLICSLTDIGLSAPYNPSTAIQPGVRPALKVRSTAQKHSHTASLGSVQVLHENSGEATFTMGGKKTSYAPSSYTSIAVSNQKLPDK